MPVSLHAPQGAAVAVVLATLVSSPAFAADVPDAPDRVIAPTGTPGSGSRGAQGPVEVGDCFAENFDDYADGSVIVGQGGWEAWDMDPTFEMGLVTSAQSRSAPHSLEIDDSDDIVHTFSGIDSGKVRLTAYQYVPGDFTGQQFLIVLNRYTSSADANWSSQIFVDGDANTVNDFDGGNTLPLVRDAWVQYEMLIDLEQDRQQVFYNGSLLFEDSWTEHATGGGDLNIAAIDLFNNGGSLVYWDDITICRVQEEFNCKLDEDFDDYTDGSVIVGQGGWEAWDMDPTFEMGLVTSAQSRSAPHSLEIDDSDDIVHTFSGIDSGKVRLTAYQYVPGDFTGQQFLIVLNRYTSSADANWSTQIFVDGEANTVNDFDGGSSLPLVRDAWVQYELLIDLEQDRQQVFYNGSLLFDDSWTEHATGGGDLNIAAIDLFNNGGSLVYWDDIRICHCDLDEDFDAYAAGSTISGQGGWEPWNGDPTVQFGTVTTDQSRSAPHSLEIDDVDDIVHQFSGLDYTSGRVRVEAYQYVPEDFVGSQTLILLNTYPTDGNQSWSAIVEMDGDLGTVFDQQGAGSTTLLRGAWIQLEAIIDLDLDRQQVFYNGQLIIDDSWANHVLSGGALNLAAIDLFNSDGTRVYWDDITVCEIPNTCPADTDRNGDVNFQDIVAVIGNWGPYEPCPPYKPADIDRNCTVNFQDLVQVLGAWGPCD